MISLFKNIARLVNRVVDVVSQGSWERVRVLNAFESVFKNAFELGEIDLYCTVTTGKGDPSKRHELSTFTARSGFKITIQNDNYKLIDSKFVDLAKYVVGNVAFVRRLMALGYDSLIVYGKNTKKAYVLGLKDVADFHDYMLD